MQLAATAGRSLGANVRPGHCPGTAPTAIGKSLHLFLFFNPTIFSAITLDGGKVVGRSKSESSGQLVGGRFEF